MSRYTLDGRLGKLLVRGAQLGADVAEAVTAASLDLTTSEVSELSLSIADPGLKLLAARLFTAGTPTQAGSRITYGPLSLEVRSVEVNSGPSLTILARDAGAYRLKRTRGVLVRRGLSPTQAAQLDARAAGLGFVGEPSPKRPTVARTKDESAYDSAARWAEELGYSFFISAGVVYFARPSFLVRRPAKLVLRWNADPAKADPLIRDIPACKRSGDDANGKASSFDVDLLGALGDKALPGMAATLSGVPTFDGAYMVDRVGITLDATSPTAVSASTPINPDPQKPDPTDETQTGITPPKDDTEATP